MKKTKRLIRTLLFGVLSYCGMLTASAAPIPPTPTASISYSSYIYVNWSSVSGASTGYAIYRSTSPTFSWGNRIATTTSTYYYDYNATPGVKYYYWIGPRDSSYTVYINTARYDWGKRSGLTPPTPTASTSYSSYIYVSWSSVSGASTGYAIYRSTSPTFSWNNRIATTSSTYYYDYNATPGVKYYYWIGPRDSSYTVYINTARYGWGKRLGTPPTPPTPTPSTSYSSYIYVSWSSVSGASTGYAIYRSTSPTFSWNNRIATTSSTYYYDYNATPGVKYYYWIGPRDSSYTVYINTARYGWGKRLGTPPTPPTPVVSYTYTGYVKVSWSSVSGASTGYAIYRSTSPTFSWSNRLATTTSTTYYDYSATPGRTYYYWIGPRDSSYTIYINTGRYDWGWCY